MQLAVYFNNVKGIEALMKELDISEIDGKMIDLKDSIDRVKYFIDGDTIIKNYFNVENYYTDAVLNGTSVLESKGETTFITKKTSGIHNYQIENSIGVLTHTNRYLKKESKAKTLISKFIKVGSPHDKISIKNISQLFNKIIISPEFTQTILVNGVDEGFLDHKLYGVTALYPLPYPSHSNTLYLYEHKPSGKLIPIGYSQYFYD